jgi:membrane protease YdiL (CAAX protease family)
VYPTCVEYTQEILSRGAVLVSLIVGAVLLLFFPVFSLITEVPIRLKSDWLWILVGATALNGIAEETLFRGFVFGGLRRAGHPFRNAGTISLLIFAAVHLFLFIQGPFIVGVLGTLVAVVAAFPMAFLFERGNNTIWAPMMLHVTAHAIRLVDIPAAHFMLAVSAWSFLQIGMPFLVFAFRITLLKPQAQG